MKVTIVCGAPASGKTSYVKKNMQIGDFVVDLDAIRSAVGFVEKAQRVDNLLPSILQIRDYIYSMIEHESVETTHCWIIAGLPKEQDRKALAERFCANVVFLNVSEEECIHRAMLDPERTDKEHQIEIISKYFADMRGKRVPGNSSLATRELAMYYKDLED